MQELTVKKELRQSVQPLDTWKPQSTLLTQCLEVVCSNPWLFSGKTTNLALWKFWDSINMSDVLMATSSCLILKRIHRRASFMWVSSDFQPRLDSMSVTQERLPCLLVTYLAAPFLICWWRFSGMDSMCRHIRQLGELGTCKHSLSRLSIQC